MSNSDVFPVNAALAPGDSSATADTDVDTDLGKFVTDVPATKALPVLQDTAPPFTFLPSPDVVNQFEYELIFSHVEPLLQDRQVAQAIMFLNNLAAWSNNVHMLVTGAGDIEAGELSDVVGSMAALVYEDIVNAFTRTLRKKGYSEAELTRIKQQVAHILNDDASCEAASPVSSDPSEPPLDLHGSGSNHSEGVS